MIETDAEPGLSGWIDRKTKEKIRHPTGKLSKEFLEQYNWDWDRTVLKELLNSKRQDVQFFCGGANNQQEFYSLFTKKFELLLDDETLVKRLQARDPDRWIDSSPDLEQTLRWNTNPKRFTPGDIIIKTDRTIQEIVDELLEHIAYD
mgnify:FL=1